MNLFKKKKRVHEQSRYTNCKRTKAKQYVVMLTETISCGATLFRCKFSSMFPVFHLARSPYSATKNFCCGLKKGVAKSRALVYFEPQILLVFHRTHNLSRNKCRHIRFTPSKSTNQRAAFLQPATNVIVARQVDHAR